MVTASIYFSFVYFFALRARGTNPGFIMETFTGCVSTEAENFEGFDFAALTLHPSMVNVFKIVTAFSKLSFVS